MKTLETGKIIMIHNDHEKYYGFIRFQPKNVYFDKRGFAPDINENDLTKGMTVEFYVNTNRYNDNLFATKIRPCSAEKGNTEKIRPDSPEKENTGKIHPLTEGDKKAICDAFSFYFEDEDKIPMSELGEILKYTGMNYKSYGFGKAKDFFAEFTKKDGFSSYLELSPDNMSVIFWKNEETTPGEKKQYTYHPHQKKTLAKAIGLKSAFALDEDKVLMTSFGKGNDAVPEIMIEGNQQTILRTPPSLRLGTAKDSSRTDAKEEAKETGALLKKELRFSKAPENKPEALTRNPLYSPISPANQSGMDATRTKDQWEMRFFGRTFPDNIHIQLIYNILDIEKILAQYSNNIVYTVNHIVRNNSDITDHIGGMNLEFNYDEFRGKKREWFENLCKSPYLLYFGNAFFCKNKDERQKRKNKEIYSLLCAMGCVRQHVTHKGQESSSLYRLSDKKIRQEHLDLLDKLYNEKIEEIDRNFEKNNQTNFKILLPLCRKWFPEVSAQNIVNDFYRFTILKDYKNLGFSIRQLREEVLKNQNIPGWAEGKTDPEFHKIRRKLNMLLDFLIASHYRYEAETDCDRIVRELRFARESEEKNRIYEKESKQLSAKLRKIIDELIDVLKDENTYKKEKNNQNPFTSQIKLSQSGVLRKDFSDKSRLDADYFCKVIYAMTLFLDGKEINDLLTTLIHKFDNIRSFIDIMDENKQRGIGDGCELTEPYRMFRHSGEICRDLKTINSFARMTSPAEEAPEDVKIDALMLFGEKDRDNARELLRKNKKLRNFLSNNVVKSSRFLYLARYTDIASCKVLSKDKRTVKFVLRQIPEKQIVRYCESCNIPEARTAAQRIDALAEKIAGVSPEMFRSIGKKKGDEPQNNPSGKKQKSPELKNVIGLYLTVLYIFIKNLVNINSRYVIAFHCLERDEDILEIKKAEENEINSDLTSKFIENHYIKESYRPHIESAQKKMNAMQKEYGNICKQYRNSVAHLNIISAAPGLIKIPSPLKGPRYPQYFKSEIRSYFEIYHFLLQKYLRSMGYLPPCVYFSYNKDLLKSLNVPFGYNLARYKNLSVEPLFDKNHPPEQATPENKTNSKEPSAS